MDMSGLLSTLKWIGAIFPIFNVEFPFHIAYDIIIRLASSWILEDSVGEIADFFNTALHGGNSYLGLQCIHVQLAQGACEKA